MIHTLLSRCCVLGFLLVAGCYAMQDEHVLVLDAASHQPVAGIELFKQAKRFPFTWGFPLPKASEAVTDPSGRATLRVPKDHRFFLVGVGSDLYEWDFAARQPTTRPWGIDEIYYVRRREVATTERTR